MGITRNYILSSTVRPTKTARRLRLSLLVLVLGLASAAIAVGVRHWTRGAPLYTLGATERCLLSERRVLNYSEAGADWFAAAAPGGGVLVGLHDNAVVLAFEQSPEDARRIREQAELVARGTTYLSQERNVYLRWDRRPTAIDRSTIEGCLRRGTVPRIQVKEP